MYSWSALAPGAAAGGRWALLTGLAHAPGFWIIGTVAWAGLYLAPSLLAALDPALEAIPAGARARALRPLGSAWIVGAAAAWIVGPWEFVPALSSGSLLFAATGIGLAGAAWRVRAQAVGPIGVGDFGRRLLWLVLVLGFLAVPGWPQPQGDEPHYLVVVQSLLQDHDLDVADDYLSAEYRAYHPEPLSPHHKPGIRPGSRYSMHGVGYPLLLAPAYALGEYFGAGGGVLAARGFQTLVFALFVLALYRLIETLAGRRAALFGTAACALAAPVVFAPLHLFPETPAMAASCAATLWLLRDDGRRDLLAGGLLATLPWLGVKYIPLALVLAVLVPWVARPADARQRLARTLGPLLGSLAGHAAFTWVLYGSLSPSAVYLGSDPSFGRAPGFGNQWQEYLWAWPGALRSFVGYFIDQKEGVLAVGPHWLLAAAGLPWLRRRHPRLLVLILVATAAYLGPYALSQQAGGQSPPARPAMAILWLLAIPLGAALSLPMRGVAAACKGGLSMIATAITCALFVDPSMLPHDYGVEASWLLRRLSPAGWPLWKAFPVYLGAHGIHWGGVQLAWLAGVIALAAAIAVSASAARGRRQRMPSLAGWGAAAYALVAVAVVGCAVARVPVSERHIGGEIGQGRMAWIQEAIPAHGWVERDGVWARSGQALDIVLEEPPGAQPNRVALRTLVRSQVTLQIEDRVIEQVIAPGPEVEVAWPPVAGWTLGSGQVAYRLRLFSASGAAPARVSGGQDFRQLGVHVRLLGQTGGGNGS